MAPQAPLPPQGGPPSPSTPTARTPPCPAPARPPPPPLQSPEDAKLQLATRRLQSGESLADVADDLLRLTRLAYPRMDPASQDELARDRLLVEVEDHAVRKRARLSRPLTVAAVLRAISGTAPSTPTNDTSTTAASASLPAPGALPPPPPPEHHPCCPCTAGTTAADMKALTDALRENTEAARRLTEKLKAGEPATPPPSRRGWLFF